MALIKVSNLSVSIGKRKILKNVNLSLNEGEVISLSGDNGSGKSMLLKVIFGEFNGLDVEGQITYQDVNILDSSFNFQAFRRKIGYVPQEDSFCQETPFQEACYSFKLHCGANDENYITNLFNTFDIAYLMQKKLFSKHGPQLSGGEKKMVSLISVLCRKDSDLFLIDEPFNNLDSKNVRTISNMINSIHKNNPKAGIIIVTHCHALSCVTKQYSIVNSTLEQFNEDYKCFNCFGTIDENGYYRV